MVIYSILIITKGCDSMADIQSTFHKITKGIKKGYEDGVNKFQTSQEVLDLKDRVSQNEAKRLELIATLGENHYLKYRNGEIQDEHIEEICSRIAEIDKKIFKDLRTIEEKIKIHDEKIVCECGASLTPDDKFCKNCGKSIKSPDEELIEKTICPHCDEETPLNSKYCNCCGKQIS